MRYKVTDSRTVTGRVYREYFGIHKEHGRWIITHLPTGRAIYMICRNYTQAIDIVDRIMPMWNDWDFNTPDVIPDYIQKKIVEAILNDIK